jgi:GrpB-like predicted nucleotidyltransferase (UPF0157 family)
MSFELHPYDPDCPNLFCELSSFIRQVLPFAATVEHVGSTSVEGLGGKGIVDCLVVLPEGDVDTAVTTLREKGFDHSDHSRHGDDRWFASGTFERAQGKPVHVHIHITYRGSNCERETLSFRDYLRAHPQEARRYWRLKEEWRRMARSDLAVYTTLKTPYIRGVLAKASRHGGH